VRSEQWKLSVVRVSLPKRYWISDLQWNYTWIKYSMYIGMSFLLPVRIIHKSVKSFHYNPTNSKPPSWLSLHSSKYINGSDHWAKYYHSTKSQSNLTPTSKIQTQLVTSLSSPFSFKSSVCLYHKTKIHRLSYTEYVNKFEQWKVISIKRISKAEW
jgi:hypothetical protein